MTAEAIWAAETKLQVHVRHGELARAKEKIVAYNPGQPVKNSGAASSNSMPRGARVDAVRV